MNISNRLVRRVLVVWLMLLVTYLAINSNNTSEYKDIVNYLSYPLTLTLGGFFGVEVARNYKKKD